MSGGNVQIPAELYWNIVTYFLKPPAEEWEAEELQREIERGLESKIEAQLRRELFSRYKRAADPAEREAARVAYLDEIGMRASFRSSQPPEEPPE